MFHEAAPYPGGLLSFVLLCFRNIPAGGIEVSGPPVKSGAAHRQGRA
jgi:hypothetical protein